jgi:hypothetical protein
VKGEYVSGRMGQWSAFIEIKIPRKDISKLAIGERVEIVVVSPWRNKRARK